MIYYVHVAIHTTESQVAVTDTGTVSRGPMQPVMGEMETEQ